MSCGVGAVTAGRPYTKTINTRLLLVSQFPPLGEG